VTTTASNALHDSARVYTRPVLKIYDAVIMGLLARWVWRCPPSLFINLYDALVSKNHAEIGVGTGYCLDRCRADISRLALIDLNPNCVDHARERLERFAPTTHVRNALEPIYVSGGPFDSVALGGVLHCLPGSMRDKGRVFDNLRPVLTKSSVVFGYTLVSDTGSLEPAAVVARALLNRLRFVNNYSDLSDGLRRELEIRFDEYVVTRVGAIAFFIASQYSREGGETHAL
jgi:hypothetical protein